MAFAPKLGLLLHAALAVAVAGAGTHNGVLAARHLLGRPVRASLRKSYATVLLWLYVANFLVGAIIYPWFRIDVRAAYFDVELPLLTGLFEIKEHWAALGLFMLLAMLPIAKSADLKSHNAMTRTYDAMCLIVTVIIWYLCLAGFFLVSVKSI